MRDVFLAAVILAGLIATLRYPFAGIILWTWFTCMNPHQDAWGFMTSAPINLIIAIVTVAAWVFSRERKQPVFDATFILLVGFLVWVTFNGFFAVDPDWSWGHWDQLWRTIILGVFISAIAKNKVRVHALVWTVVISLFYYSVKGGIFTILTGGHNQVLGPPNSQIGDNNTLALAVLMVLPLANYLRLNSAHRLVRNGAAIAIALTVLSVLGSYSRGGFVGLAALGFAAWFRARKKLVYPLAAAIIIIPAIAFMPVEYIGRINTIADASNDDSFQGRVTAWHVAWDYAVDHFPLGDGLDGAQLPVVFNHYYPHYGTHAAHSIFFEVLGDNGFPGLAIYLAILATAFFNCAQIRKASKDSAQFQWAFDLAGMMQLSLFVFCVAGAALSMAYYDVLFVWLGLLSAVRQMTRNLSPAKAFRADIVQHEPTVALGAEATT